MLNFYDHLLNFCSVCIATERVITVYVARFYRSPLSPFYILFAFFKILWVFLIIIISYYVSTFLICIVPTLFYLMPT
jgi:hypothetical protein